MVLQIYLVTVGVLTLIWWPGSHWLFPSFYHRVMGFTEQVDGRLVKIIGTCGLLPGLALVIAGCDPLASRGVVVALLPFFGAMATTFAYLTATGQLPKREWINAALFGINGLVIGVFYPW